VKRSVESVNADRRMAVGQSLTRPPADRKVNFSYWRINELVERLELLEARGEPRHGPGGSAAS